MRGFLVFAISVLTQREVIPFAADTTSMKKRLPYLLLYCLLLAGGHLTAQLTCNQNIQLSLGPDCTATVLPDDVLEGYDGNDADYIVDVLNDQGQSLGNVVGVDQLGQSLTARVTQLSTGNSCWGHLFVEDKLGPVCVDQALTISCLEDLADVAAPLFTDNCDPDAAVSLVDDVRVDDDICDDGNLVIVRTYIAYDNLGNAGDLCTQTITVQRVPILFPEDINFSCTQYNLNPGITDVAPLDPGIMDSLPAVPGIQVPVLTPDSLINLTGAGEIDAPAFLSCNYALDIVDDTLDICDNTTIGAFKILRTFTVFDWCASAVITTDANGNDATQVIKVEDNIAPVVRVDPIVLSANLPGVHPQPCRSTGPLPAPVIIDECSAVTVQIFTPIGEAVYTNGVDGSAGGTVPLPGLPVGPAVIVYRLTDGCGNVTELGILASVVDDVAPVVICDAITTVSLGNDGLAEVDAEVFSDGTYDNCCLDRLEVRRMTDNCGFPIDTIFGPSIRFCCEDVAAGAIMVNVRAFDCAGNFNDCMVEILVEDKLDPVVQCLPELTITCAQFDAQLETGLALGDGSVLDGFGLPAFADNCGILIDTTVQVVRNGCGEGFINRFFTATSANGVQAFCQQTINIITISNYVVVFPEDQLLTCDTPEPMSIDEPVVFFEDCELVGISFVDQQFDVVQDACYKITRTWEVINWCVVGDVVDQEATEASEEELIPILGGPNSPLPNCDLDGDGDCDARTFRDSWTLTEQPGNDLAGIDAAPDTDPDDNPWDGFIRYQQQIKVNDNTPPDVDAGDDLTICITSADCTVDFVLPTPDVKDCSPDLDVVIFGDLMSPDGSITGAGPGVYSVLYRATDNCGNFAEDELIITLEDCKAPTVICRNGVIVSLGDDGEAELWASDLIKDAVDNCTDSMDLVYSFSADTSDTNIILNCTTQNTFIVTVYVTDEAGNQDFCETFIEVDDNDFACPGALVALDGSTFTRTDAPLPGVNVSLSNGTPPTPTDGAGQFHFDLLEGADYTVVPTKNDDPTNGVTTYDLVLISQHILGTQPFTTPEQRIAADANNSQSITALDIVALRRLILFIDLELANNSSWRFVDATHSFADPADPWATPFPELVNFNNVAAGNWRADFTAIKIGDVNDSATPQLHGAGDAVGRNAAAWELRTTDRYLRAGEAFELELRAAVLPAFQFTLGYDIKSVELEVREGGRLDQRTTGRPAPGVLTASYNGTADDAPVLRLRGTALRDGWLSESLHLRNDYTPAAAYASDGAVHPVRLRFDATKTGGTASLTARPNPFRTHTELRLDLPQAGRAHLRVIDAAGREVWTDQQTYRAGTHRVRFERPAQVAPGVLFAQLITDEGVVTVRLVVE